MYKTGRMLTIEEQLEASRRFLSERQVEQLRVDIESTRQQLQEIMPLMTQQMLQGVAQNSDEKVIIKRYNKLSRHWAKLMSTLTRWSWRM